MPLSDRDKLSWGHNGPPNIYYPEKLPAEAGCWQLIIPRLAEHDSPDDDSLSTSKIFISLALRGFQLVQFLLQLGNLLLLFINLTLVLLLLILQHLITR